MTPVLDQVFQCADVSAEMMDQLWASGWRHFGPIFFRYSLSEDEEGLRTITPLRLDLQNHTLSKSQRRVLRRNADLRCEFHPAEMTEAACGMFQRHKGRFQKNVPEGLDNFLSQDPARVPCECRECRVYLGEELIALSYLDVGQGSSSAVYGMFEPAHTARSLGIYTMLREIEHTQSLGFRYYYPGYATREPSAYDYKKQLRGLEELDWETGAWRPLQRSTLECEL